MTINLPTGNSLGQGNDHLVELEDVVRHSNVMGQKGCWHFEQNICRCFEEDSP